MQAHLETTTTRGAWRHLRRVLPISLAIAVTLLMGNADVWAKGNTPPPPPAASAPARSGEPSAEDVQLARELATANGIDFDKLYGDREKAAQTLEAFEGGDYIIITGTTLAIVLLVVLLIILL
jgi:hypothetical protein